LTNLNKSSPLKLKRTFQGCYLPSVSSFGNAVAEEYIFLEIDQSEKRIACGGHV
jgi:hypothetical protein